MQLVRELLPTADREKPMPVDTDTKKFLEDVRKGKPRRFVIICKGIKIPSMFVYRKGTVESYKKKAKDEGKGQFYHGVVTGKGENIVFNPRRDDGYEKPPGKELILKDFLKSEAGLKFKPVYEIVETLPDVDESDNEETGTEEVAAKTIDVSDLESQLMELQPGVLDFVRDHSERRVEILKPNKLVKNFIAAPEGKDRQSAVDALATFWPIGPIQRDERADGSRCSDVRGSH